MRELVRQDPRDIGPALVTLADKIAAQAAALKDELIAKGLVPAESQPADAERKRAGGNGQKRGPRRDRS